MVHTVKTSYYGHLSCMPVVYVQTSRDASKLIESLSVVETLLLFVNFGSSCRKPSYLATFLDNHATKELLQGWTCRI